MTKTAAVWEIATGARPNGERQLAGNQSEDSDLDSATTASLVARIGQLEHLLKIRRNELRFWREKGRRLGIVAFLLAVANVVLVGLVAFALVAVYW